MPTFHTVVYKTLLLKPPSLIRPLLEVSPGGCSERVDGKDHLPYCDKRGSVFNDIPMYTGTDPEGGAHPSFFAPNSIKVP